MFGYIANEQAGDQDEGFDMYRTFYCTADSAENCVIQDIGQITLSYDMTFVIMLLSAFMSQRRTRALQMHSSSCVKTASSKRM